MLRLSSAANSAFAAIQKDVDKLLKPENKTQLAKVLTYHVVAGKIMAKDVVAAAGKSVKTVQGGELTVVVLDGGKVGLIDAMDHFVRVSAVDVAASNGVIHVVDSVLMPK